MREAVILTRPQRRALSAWVLSSLPDTRERDERFGTQIIEYAGLTVWTPENEHQGEQIVRRHDVVHLDTDRLIEAGVPAEVFEAQG